MPNGRRMSASDRCTPPCEPHATKETRMTTKRKALRRRCRVLPRCGQPHRDARVAAEVPTRIRTRGTLTVAADASTHRTSSSAATAHRRRDGRRSRVPCSDQAAPGSTRSQASADVPSPSSAARPGRLRDGAKRPVRRRRKAPCKRARVPGPKRREFRGFASGRAQTPNLAERSGAITWRLSFRTSSPTRRTSSYTDTRRARKRSHASTAAGSGCNVADGDGS